MDKIDILKLNDVIITQDLMTQEQTYFTISELNDEMSTSYINFISLVNSKTSVEYKQIYVAKEPTIRFVGLNVDGVIFNNMEETLYEDLTNDEKIIYDNFYNNFTN